MRRSLAPSQRTNITNQESTLCARGTLSSLSLKGRNENPKCNKKDEIVIQRMPMFGFLEIPDDLRKQFKVPTGCVITDK
jgi:hypothetical protein